MPNELVFLCGFPSSGTDLLKNVMNAHPDVDIGGEFPFLPQLAQRFGATVAASQAPQAVAALKECDVYNNLARTDIELSSTEGEYELAALYAEMLTEKSCTWTGNKTPQNTEHIERLRQLFPRARFVLIVRDVRDVALSWSRKWGRHKPSCAHKWHTRMQRGAQDLAALKDGTYLIVRYEDLLADVETVANRLCEFLGLEFFPGMLNYHSTVEQTVEGKLNYGKPLIRDNTNKWRRALSTRQVRRLEEIAFATLQKFDYPVTQAAGARSLTRIEKWVGYVWDAIAILVVGNRAIEKNRFRHRCKMLVLEFRKQLSRAGADRSL